MAYCTIDDFIALNGFQELTEVSTPNIAQVNSFITQISAEIDVILKTAGVAGTVTDEKGLEYLKMMNAVGAAYWGAMSGYAPYGQTAEKLIEFRKAQYEKMVEMLKNSPELCGATVSATSCGFASDYNGQENTRATFTMNGVDW